MLRSLEPLVEPLSGHSVSMGTGFALPSFLSIPVFTPMSQFLIGTLTALVLTMVLTLVFGYESKDHKESSIAKKKD